MLSSSSGITTVPAECVFVLESFYEHPRADIASAHSRLVSSPGVEISEMAIHLDALDRCKGQRFISWVVSFGATAAPEIWE